MFKYSLEPYSFYTVIVYAITGAGSGGGTSIDKQTGQSSKRFNL